MARPADSGSLGRLGTPPLRQLARRAADRVRPMVRDLYSCFAANNLLTYASAISWQSLFALVPLALAGLAFLGFFNLEEVWKDDLAPRIREQVSQAGFQVIDSTVDRILGAKRGFWLTFGLGLAIWQVSGAIRAAIGALNHIYDVDDTRSFVRRHVLSIALATSVAGLFGLALVAFHFGDRLAPELGLGGALTVVASVLRWLIAAALLFVVVGILVRFAPAARRPMPWVGFTSGLVVVSWLVGSLVFGWYVRTVASYDSIFGNVSIVIVLMTYIYISAVIFLVGIQLDALARRRVADD